MLNGLPEDLRLAVMDADDLAVVSAHLQDAEMTIGDMAFLPAQARFALALSRFDWPLAAQGRFARCAAGLHFERVLKVSRSGLPEPGSADTLRLLAIAFVQDPEPPSGHVLLTFVGGGRIRLKVECLEAEMRDLGSRWDVPGRPPLLDASPQSD